MSAFTAEADGAATLARTLEQAGEDLTALTALNRSLGGETLAAAQIPRLTGHLASTAYVDADDTGFALAATAPYAGIVHARNPFFTDALEKRTDRIIDGYTTHLTHVLDTVKGA